jgi:hypothetical protein
MVVSLCCVGRGILGLRSGGARWGGGKGWCACVLCTPVVHTACKETLYYTACGLPSSKSRIPEKST